MAGRVRHLVQRGDSFWARVVVPKNLRLIIGRTELRFPLGGNRKIAERALHAAVAAMEDQLSAAQAKLDVVVPLAARMRARPLTVAQIAHTHFAEEMALDAAERDHPEQRDVPDTAWAREGYANLLRRVASGRASNDEARAAVGWALAKFQGRGNTAVKAETAEWRALARTMAQVQLEAIDVTIERDAGREPAMPMLPILAELPNASVVPLRQRGPAVSIIDLLDGYLRTLKAQGKGAEAERRWKPTFKALVRYLGHDDARHMTKGDIAGWRDHLLETKKLAPKTIRDVHLAALRVVLNWATDNDKLPENPAARVRINVAKKTRTREKGFTDAEAIAILAMAQFYVPPQSNNPATRESPYSTAAKRWLPWLCALTGARIAEMAQLRVQDVQIRDEITYLRINPDAGSVKTGQYRDVPVHPQLEALGFLQFVKDIGDGPLFFDPSKRRKGIRHPSKIVAVRVSNWVRSLDIASDEVDPSHGWRHRFKTVGREAEISDRVIDALQGHAGRTAGDDYGDTTLKTRMNAIARIPFYTCAPT